MKNKIPQEEMEVLAKIAVENYERITDSAIFMCIWNEAMLRDVIPLIQMGIAVYTDKPILIIVPESRRDSIPKNLQKIAVGVRFYKDDNIDSMNEAVKELIELMGE